MPRHVNPGDSHRKAEPPRTRTTRIEVEDPVAKLDRGLMRVPRHHSGEASDRRVDVKLGNLVQHVEQEFANLDRLCGWKIRCPRPLSLLPRTTKVGAISCSSSITWGLPMSPAWMRSSDPLRALTASGRTRPCVSERCPQELRSWLRRDLKPPNAAYHPARGDIQRNHTRLASRARVHAEVRCGHLSQFEYPVLLLLLWRQ